MKRNEVKHGDPVRPNGGYPGLKKTADEAGKISANPDMAADFRFIRYMERKFTQKNAFVPYDETCSFIGAIGRYVVRNTVSWKPVAHCVRSSEIPGARWSSAGNHKIRHMKQVFNFMNKILKTPVTNDPDGVS